MRKVRAMVMAGLGEPEVLQLGHLVLPDVKPTEVRLKVLAAGFNPIDTKVRSGLAPIAPVSGVLGCDVCGEILEVGGDVDDLSLGDRVFGFIGGAKHLSGALSEEVVVDRGLVTLAPKSWSPEHIAILPVTGITAMESLERLGMDDSDELLILGASGGVGQLAVQIAASRGVRVVGTAGNSNRCDRVNSLGATEVVLHDETIEWVRSGRQFSRIFDTYGVASFDRALELASPYGHVLTINARGQHELSLAHAKSLSMHAIFIIIPLLTPGMSNKSHIRCLDELGILIDSGKLVTSEVEVLPVQQVADVHRRYEAGELKNRVAFVWD